MATSASSVCHIKCRHLPNRIHVWLQVLLFYPDGKRSSSSDTHVNPAGIPGVHPMPAAPPANPQNAPQQNGLPVQQQAPPLSQISLRIPPMVSDSRPALDTHAGSDI